MAEILAGIGVSIVGLLLVFGGYAFARILLTVWGLIFGFVLGGSLVNDLTTSGFLNNSLGIFLGIVLGLVFAALAYAFFYVAVVLAGAALGFVIGSSFLQLFGMDPNFLTTMLGIAAGAVLGLAFIMFNLPRAFLIVVTAFSGATLTIGGLLLMFNQIPLEYFSYQTARIAVGNSVFWTIGAFVLALLGIVTQSMVSTNNDIDNWSAEKNTPASTPAVTE